MSQTKWRPFFDIKQLFEDTSTSISKKDCWNLEVDLYENDNYVFAEMNMPCIDPDTVELAVVGSYLKITGCAVKERFNKRSEHQDSKTGTSFKRTIQLPIMVRDVDPKAVYANGILKIRIPKEYSVN